MTQKSAASSPIAIRENFGRQMKFVDPLIDQRVVRVLLSRRTARLLQVACDGAA